MNRMRFWPFGALIVLAVAGIAAIAAAVLFKYQRSAQASALPNAARIERVNGQVGINQNPDNATSPQWIEATANMPLGVGDRIYTKENSKTEIGFTGRNFAAIDQNTSLDMLELSERRTQVALREGSALFDVGSISSGNLFEVATPCGAVDLEQPGIYQISINKNGNAVATAFSGEAQVVGQGGSGRIQKGEYLEVPCQGNAPAVMSRVEPNQAGSLIDNYYRYRYPKTYDGRYRSYYTYLDDPYYYDPAGRYTSYNYVSDYIPGIDDLDDYGDWQYVSDYGYCWHPRVYNDWAPYQSGYWTMDYPYGLTWVSSEPWGYAPYHYGRWAYASNEWFWVPESTRIYPTYSPALVAFIPLSQSSVAWVALGPSDPYVTRYYDPYWQPAYVYPSNVVIDRVVNLNVPGAVTVVPVQEFTSVIDPRVISRVDPQTLARVRPVLDPLAVDPLRKAAFQTREAQRRIDVPRDVAQRIANTPVVAGNSPIAPPFRRDLARALKVEPLSNRVKNQKLQVSDQRAEAARPTVQQPNIAAEQARERQMADLARQGARGDRSARQQMQELRKQQTSQQRLAGARVAGQAQGERVSEQMQQTQRKANREQQQAQKVAARQQMITSQQQQRAAAQQQMQSQREQRRQSDALRTQQRATRHSQQQQVLRPQAPPQQRREAKPPQYQLPAQPRVIAPQPPQVRPQVNRGQTERRAAPQPQPVRPPQAQPKPQPQAAQQQKPPAHPKPPEQKGGGRKKPPDR
jgi:hypothetical protein